MRLPRSWLRSFVDLPASDDEIAEALVRLGHEVEAVEHPRAALARVRVGRILTMEPHPNADRLRLLTVDVGAAAPLQIVCGATNMAVGDKVPVATVGATLPGGVVIKKGRIRGEESCGMCCSGRELQLADDAEGLLILPDDAEVGMAMGDWLGLEETIFALSITPNRGDCMSIFGLARELAAEMDRPLRTPNVAAVAVDSEAAAPQVDLRAADGAPCYLARTIRGVRVAPSPAWLQQRLLAMGQRPVNGVVDVLNFVMFELGQPMHAFDAARIRGPVVVRRAVGGERIDALDGHRYELNSEDLVIADGRGVLALAGIIGSEESCVTEQTTDLLIESAFFTPAGISRSRRRLGVVSEASMRFERGVDPAQVACAMERATALILDLFGGRAGGVRRCGALDGLLESRTISTTVGRIEARLGLAVEERFDAVLRRMGFGVTRSDGRISVVVPPFRHDISLPEDLSEEYGRIIGYDAIPTVAPRQAAVAPVPRDAALEQAVAGGFTQVVNYAFISVEEQRLFDPDPAGDLLLANPISEAMAVMRRSLFVGLLRSAQYNLNRQQPFVALVEQGRGYRRTGKERFEEYRLIGWLMAGAVEPDGWYGRGRPAEFRDLKGAVECWLDRRGITARFIADDRLPGLQPGQSAAIMVGRDRVGVLGRIQPQVADRFQIDLPVFVAQIALDRLPARRKAVRFMPLPEYPAIVRDLVMAFPCTTTAAEILQAASRAGGRLLESVEIFDRFTGEGVERGWVSIGLRCRLRDGRRTLTQEEAEQVIRGVAGTLAKRFGAVRR
ncbi:MAG: phenylalanine--tRNA ligase subunit beta [Zetaproteobacteria bacterium]|nr:MAG: phenylalanine--tRNA ligase subunit beta [Zetaproteobacteria bacterium]